MCVTRAKPAGEPRRRHRRRTRKGRMACQGDVGATFELLNRDAGVGALRPKEGPGLHCSTDGLTTGAPLEGRVERASRQGAFRGA